MNQRMSHWEQAKDVARKYGAAASMVYALDHLEATEIYTYTKLKAPSMAFDLIEVREKLRRMMVEQDEWEKRDRMMTRPRTSLDLREKLACGCVRGYFLCPEAEALWADVNAAYRRWASSQGRPQRAWQAYKDAAAEYKAHFRDKEEGDKQNAIEEVRDAVGEVKARIVGREEK